MKETILTRFKKFESDDIGAIPTLSIAVRGMKYGNSEINLSFKKLVPKDEYEQDERDEILEWLYKQTKDGEIAL